MRASRWAVAVPRAVIVLLLVLAPPNAAGGGCTPQGSLFDALFASPGGTAQPPFPFSALLAVLERHAGRDSQGRSRLKHALIPYGRSLQRHAAGSKPMVNPRIVVAVDTGVAPTQGQPGFWLKDRLFIAYHPSTAQLEVISFNEHRGRFDFQVVSDYRADTAAQTRAADRRLCLSCHRNQGPIFAEDNWDETHANPAIATALDAAGGRWTGAWLQRAPAVVGAFDNATDRASLLPVYAEVWAKWCQGSLQERLKCRLGGLEATLLQRLGPFAFFTPRPGTPASAFLADRERRWRELWPHGLVIRTADLTNRNPLQGNDPFRLDASTDPLRDVRRTLRWGPRIGLNRVIIGLAESLPDAELRHIDRALIRRFESSPMAAARKRVVASGACVLARPRIVECRMQARGDAARIEVRLSKEADGRLEPRHVSAHDGSRFHALTIHPQPRPAELASGTLASGTLASGATQQVQLRQRGRGLSLRLSDGTRLGAFELPRNIDALTDTLASVTLVDDLTALDEALAALARTALDEPGHPLRAPYFHGPRLAGAVAAQLGHPPSVWQVAMPCAESNHMAMQSDPASYAPRSRPAASHRTLAPPKQAALATLRRACGGCHEQPESYPPNFLFGSPSRIEARIRALSSAMRYRTALWTRPSQSRPHAPMPPPSILSELGHQRTTWPNSAEFAAVQAAIGVLTER